MTNKRNHISKFIFDVITILFSLFKIIPNFISLVEIEAQIAGRSVINLLILHLIAGILLTSIWLSINGMCLVYLLSLQLSWLLSLFFICIINFTLLIITALVMIKVTHNLSFVRTRHLLRQIKQ